MESFGNYGSFCDPNYEPVTHQFYKFEPKPYISLTEKTANIISFVDNFILDNEIISFNNHNWTIKREGEMVTLERESDVSYKTITKLYTAWEFVNNFINIEKV